MNNAKKREDVLADAIRIVNGDRNNDYGEPEDNFKLIADLWNVCMSSRPDKEVGPIDVAIFLLLVKVARILSGHGKRDNWVDIAGYAACGGSIEALLNDEDE